MQQVASNLGSIHTGDTALRLEDAVRLRGDLSAEVFQLGTHGALPTTNEKSPGAAHHGREGGRAAHGPYTVLLPSMNGPSLTRRRAMAPRTSTTSSCPTRIALRVQFLFFVVFVCVF